MVFRHYENSVLYSLDKNRETLIDILRQYKKRQLENRLKYGQYFIQQYVKKQTIENETLGKDIFV